MDASASLPCTTSTLQPPPSPRPAAAHVSRRPAVREHAWGQDTEWLRDKVYTPPAAFEEHCKGMCFACPGIGTGTDATGCTLSASTTLSVPICSTGWFCSFFFLFFLFFFLFFPLFFFFFLDRVGADLIHWMLLLFRMRTLGLRMSLHISASALQT